MLSAKLCIAAALYRSTPKKDAESGVFGCCSVETDMEPNCADTSGPGGGPHKRDQRI